MCFFMEHKAFFICQQVCVPSIWSLLKHNSFFYNNTANQVSENKTTEVSNNKWVLYKTVNVIFDKKLEQFSPIT